jgi:hypothetical protein
MNTPIHPFADSVSYDAESIASASADAVESASRHPPSGNTGGKFPPEDQADPATYPFAALTDYLNCTFAFSGISDSLSAFFRELVLVFGPKFAPVIDRNRGLHGYQKSFT